MFTPRLDILPPQQHKLWPELDATPNHFTLYGGTAIALRLGHRISVDFDFFSTEPFIPMQLLASLPYLAHAKLRQTAANTLTVSVDRAGPIQLSFFGALRIGQVEPVERIIGSNIKCASLTDLGGMKIAVVTQRAEVKDYLDIHALITQAQLSLPTMLSAASSIYGEQFNPIIALKALSYHDDPGLAQLPQTIRRDLLTAIRGVHLNKLPALNPVRPWITQ